MKLSPRARIAQLACALSLFALPLSAKAGLVGHWAFDEGSGTTAFDSSGNGNDGVITAGVWGSDADRSSYLIFDGSTSVVDPSLTLPVMTTTNDFSWAVWMSSLDESTAQTDSIIIGNRKDAAGNDTVPRQFIKLTPTKFEWHQNDNGNDNVDVDDLVIDGWHHVAVVKSGTSLEYYFDGVSVATHTLTEVIGTVANQFYIGGQPNNGSIREHFNGYIDEVRIYDNALTAAEVEALFAAGSEQESIEFTDITVDAAGNVDLTWTSEDDRVYSLDFTTGFDEAGGAGGWQNYDDFINSDGVTTSLTVPANVFPSPQRRLFFRVSEVLD